MVVVGAAVGNASGTVVAFALLSSVLVLVAPQMPGWTPRRLGERAAAWLRWAIPWSPGALAILALVLHLVDLLQGGMHDPRAAKVIVLRQEPPPAQEAWWQGSAPRPCSRPWL